MAKQVKTYAYIDGANLHKGILGLGWKLDYARFRVWLTDKYKADRAYLFLGLIPKYKDLYTHLQEVGYTLVFKETTYDGQGKIKGNCDADLVLAVVRDSYENEFDRAVLVSSDGDYAGLVRFLQEKKKLAAIASPSDKCSILLKRTGAPIVYLDQVKSHLKSIK